MFRYRLHSPDGDDLGEATYAVTIKPDKERPFVGLLQLEKSVGQA